jgi:hypothetical protein
MVCLVLLAVAFPPRLNGQERANESDLKAAYLFQFGKFMYMPAVPTPPRGGTFDLCVVGGNPLADTLARITAGEKIDGRPVRVRKDVLPPDARTCAIAFISSSEHEHMDRDIAAVAGADVLTVSDDPGFLERGGMIQFVLQDNHLRFSVNLNSVSHTHLTLSALLLRVAASVTGNPKAVGGTR